MDDPTKSEYIAFFATPRGRKDTIAKITAPHENNWQCVGTPYDICHEMVELVMEADAYIVFYALEFLEILVKEKGISTESIVFVADNPGEAEFASSKYVYGVRSVILSKNEVMPNGSFEINSFAALGVSEMKFNKLAVIGNPPYQIQSEAQSNRVAGKAQAKPIYHLFVEAIIDFLNPDYLSLIIPSRWMVGGMGLDKHRERMMNDRRMKKIVHFPGDASVFSTVLIKGGVNYFLWEKNHIGECEFTDGNTTATRFMNANDIIIQDNNAVGILAKVQAITNKWMSHKVLPNKPFGLPTNFSDWKSSGVMCIAQGKKEMFVDPGCFTDTAGVIGKWKVCTSRAINPSKTTGKFHKFCMCFIAEPGCICTETYLVVNAFDTEREAINFMAYMNSTVFRFMLSMRVSTQDINRDKFSWVPDQEDYSTEWTDGELYKKYNLTRQQIAYIESTITAIE